MEREFSAGGVLVKVIRGRPMVAAIRPQGKPEGTWALPKGNLDPGEQPAETALREVLEETGVRGPARREARRREVHVHPPRRACASSRSSASTSSGRAAAGSATIDEAMRVEVAEARWLPLDEAPRLLAYGGEREMAAEGAR